MWLFWINAVRKNVFQTEKYFQNSLEVIDHQVKSVIG